MKAFTEPEAARLLGLSRLTLKRERQRGNIEYTLLGVRLIRYSQQQLDEYLERGRRRNAQPATAIAAPAPVSCRKLGRRGTDTKAALAQAAAILRRQ